MLIVPRARFGYKRRADDTLSRRFLCDLGNNPPFREVRDIEVKVSLSRQRHRGLPLAVAANEKLSEPFD